MKAKYFRYLFHRVTEGLCYSGSISNQMEEDEDAFCFLYLAGGQTCQETGTSYTMPENRYDLVILGDLAPAAVRRACMVTEQCSPGEILIPDGAKEQIRPVLQRLAAAGATQVRIVKEAEDLHKCREYFQIVPADCKERKTLMLYHADEKGTPDTEECIISVKPMTDGMICPSRADHKNLTCEMRCMLYQDFMLCKRHNQKNRKQFADGHLLCASAENQEKGSENRTSVGELAGGHRARIRIMGFADKDMTASEITEISMPEADGLARYVAGPADTGAEAVKAVVTGDSNRHFLAYGEEAGLCISGYYVPRSNNH